MRWIALCLSLLLATSPVSGPALAQDAPFGLAAPAVVQDSGLLQHILPRFSLKTGVRVVADPEGALVLASAPPGTPVFRRADVIYYLRLPEDARAQRFLDWLTSDIGRRTIDGFAPVDTVRFTTDLGVVEVTAGPVFDGDAVRGAELARVHCGRCHVVDPANRMNGMGAAPSFMALRTLSNWVGRFETFYVLKPHGAFTQITDVTPPFDPERPSPIVPVEMTLDDLEAVVAYVSATQAADLGNPLHLQ